MKRRGAKVARTLDDDIDYIVSRFNHPQVEVPHKLAPVTERVRLAALQRAAALRAAAKAVDAIYAEGYTAADAYVRTADGAAATIGARVRWRRPDTDPSALVTVRDVLVSMAADLTAIAAPPRRRRGRPSDSWVYVLVREAAIACARHGVRWTDYPDSEAGAVLDGVFRRVQWAPKDLTAEARRRYLRLGRAAQRAGRTSLLAPP